MNILHSFIVNWNDPAPKEGENFVAVVELVQNKVLFILNKTRNTWEFPGGHVEETDPNWKYSAIREYTEEVGAAPKGDIKYLFSIKNIDSKSGQNSYCHIFLHNPDRAENNGFGYAYFIEPPDNTSLSKGIFESIILTTKLLLECKNK